MKFVHVFDDQTKIYSIYKKKIPLLEKQNAGNKV